MSKQFLNERLVTSKRFAPGQSAADEADTTPGGAPRVDDLRRREEQAHRESALDENRAELRRRRAEVLDELESALLLAERRHADLAKSIAVYGEKIAAIRALPEDGPQLLEPAIQRKLREELHGAHLEMQIRRRGDPRESGAAASWTDMGFADLARIGLALFWPIVAALLAAGGIVAWVLYAVFSLD